MAILTRLLPLYGHAEDRRGLAQWWHGARPIKARPGNVESASRSAAAAGLDSALRAVPA
jgi:hypothetical protein